MRGAACFKYGACASMHPLELCAVGCSIAAEGTQHHKAGAHSHPSNAALVPCTGQHLMESTSGA